jgi:phosphatidylserine/phosphatidylglycerophosphate/cardiolipin synthase-like enzyme
MFEIHDAVLHAKIAVVYDVWTVVGSSNLDSRSVVFNNEVDAVILGHDTAAQVEAVLRGFRDVSLSRSSWQTRRIGQWPRCTGVEGQDLAVLDVNAWMARSKQVPGGLLRRPQPPRGTYATESTRTRSPHSWSQRSILIGTSASPSNPCRRVYGEPGSPVSRHGSPGRRCLPSPSAQSASPPCCSRC